MYILSRTIRSSNTTYYLTIITQSIVPRRALTRLYTILAYGRTEEFLFHIKIRRARCAHMERFVAPVKGQRWIFRSAARYEKHLAKNDGQEGSSARRIGTKRSLGE